MPLIPFKYFQEIRTFTTSNSQFPGAAPLSTEVQASRTDTDVYLRSIWMATVRYYSPGTGSPEAWWATSYVRLVISWDPEHLQDPSDVGADDPLTLGFVDLIPVYTALHTTGTYMITWSMPEGPLVLQTSRDGDGAGTRPGVIGSLFYGDQNGFFGGSAEASSLRRAQITGRVLWGSSSGP